MTERLRITYTTPVILVLREAKKTGIFNVFAFATHTFLSMKKVVRGFLRLLTAFLLLTLKIPVFPPTVENRDDGESGGRVREKQDSELDPRLRGDDACGVSFGTALYKAPQIQKSPPAGGGYAAFCWEAVVLVV